ncbi:MAG: hypothetical protein QW304_01115 [Thermoproteota archaeon]
MVPANRSKGQIILVMCITLIIVILAISTTIYLTSTQHLFFNYNPSRETVLSIDADFQRVLTRILSNATMQYNRTRSEDLDIDEMKEARTLANNTFSYWFLATQAAYSSKGINIETEWVDETIQEEKTMKIGIGMIDNQGRVIHYESHDQTYTERTLGKKLLKLFWYRPNSISAIGACINIDDVAQGVIGWRTTRLIMLNLTITSIWSDEDHNLVYYNVVVLRENEEPVNDLKKTSFELYWFDPTAPEGVYWWRRASTNEIVEVTYNGGGNYTLILKPDFWDKSQQAKAKRDSFWSWRTKPGYYQFAIVRVKDSRDIIVEAYSYPGIEYVIQENAIEPYYPNNPAKMKETYVFELLPNGTMYWFNTVLDSSNPNPPIPLPPVKQMRVFATVNYDADPDTFVEVPYQVEIWDDRYLSPSSTNFLGWRKRFINGSKLVFEVNYPPGCRRQAVRIVWLDDCDAEIPEYRVEMKVSGGLGRVDTGSYILWIVVDRVEASRNLPHVDWSISLRDRFNVSHVEYILTAYDSYRSGNTYYIPIKFPEDKWGIVPAPDRQGVSRAPVRIVAFRKSDRVVYTSPHPQQGQEVHDEIYYEDMVYIPYNVPYFLYYTNASWKKNVEITYSYLVFAGMIGGYPHDSYISQTIQRFKWGSLYTIDGHIVNGTFNNQGTYTPHRGYALGTQYGYGNYSYWAALYNESWGTSIFASQQLIDLLILYGNAYQKGGKNVDQLFVWTRGLGASRFMEYDAIRLEASQTTKIDTSPPPKGTPKVEFKFAGFMIGGGIAGDSFKYNNDKDWYDGGGTYARPFTVLYDPQTPVINDIQLDKRNAFAYDDFSENPFSTGSFTTSGSGTWTHDPNGWIRGTASEGSFTVAYSSNGIPSEASVVYVLAKERHTTSNANQYAGLTMLDESASNFYLLGFQRYIQSGQDRRRLGIWRSGQWVGQTGSSISLSDNTWFIFLGNRTLTGQYRGRTGIAAYRLQGSQAIQIGSLTYNNQQIDVRLAGLGLRDETSGGGTISTDFDFFVACADTDPRSITVTGLESGLTVILRDSRGTEVARATASSDTVKLNVITNPVIRNGIIEIRDYRGNVLFTKSFSVIVGGDVYKCLISGSYLNAVEECDMYHRMFTCIKSSNPSLPGHMPTIEDVNPFY